MHTIRISKEADKFLLKCPRLEVTRILKRIEKLSKNPFMISKKLQGNDLWSLRVGKKFRVLFQIKRNEIRIISIGYRKNIYDKL